MLTNILSGSTEGSIEEDLLVGKVDYSAKRPHFRFCEVKKWRISPKSQNASQNQLLERNSVYFS